MNKISLALSSGLLSVLLPATMVFASVDGTVAKVDATGADSYNKAVVKNICINKVKQSNTSAVVNQVMIEQNTGNNTASKNTGDGSVTTGDASAAVTIDNAGNSNELTGNDCCCEQLTAGSTKTVVTNTGYNSTNVAKAKTVTKSSKKQKNVSNKLNGVLVGQDTGSNKTNKNPGNGGTDTGMTDVLVEVHNEGDSNTLN